MEDLNRSLARLGREVAGALAAIDAEEHLDAEDRRVFLRRASSRARRTVGPATVGLAFACIVFVGAAWVIVRTPTDPAPRYWVGSPSRMGRDSEALAAGPETSFPIAFDDGSRIVLEPRARASVHRLDVTRRRVTVREGGAFVRIQPDTGIAWELAAGPFVVRVTGTRFRIEWREEEQLFRLALEEGSVVVTGQCLEGPRRMTSRETLEVRCPRRSAPDDAGIATFTPPSQPPRRALSSAGSSARNETATIVPRSSPVGPPPSFTSLVAQGRYAEAVALVEEAGFEEACRSFSAPELVALGDAARLARRYARAEQAFQAARTRFPRSGAAADAAYGLARVALDARADCRSAAPWLERYLAERPTGALRSETLGRLLECALREGSPERARTLAERYLRADLGGPYEDLARSTLAR